MEHKQVLKFKLELILLKCKWLWIRTILSNGYYQYRHILLGDIRVYNVIDLGLREVIDSSITWRQITRGNGKN